mgnify:CR=1 FL=1
MSTNQHNRESFGSRWGFILACIGSAVGMSENTVRKYVLALEERGLIVTEPTTVTTKDGRTRNGNLRFTICPIQAALQQDYDRQMQKLDEDAARQKYADLIENTG